MKEIREFLNYDIKFTDKIHIAVYELLLVLLVFIVTTQVLKLVKRIVTKRVSSVDSVKFETVFTFLKYFIYSVVILGVLDNMGVNVTAIFAASAALLVGVGLALQTFFQDIISGVFILIDQSVHVGDILEIDGKIGRVSEIKLRTTRAVTRDNKVLIIPNHKYLTSSIYNWTENGEETRESITVGVAYGTDVELVKRLLYQAAAKHPKVLKTPEPLILFSDFGDSALQFKLLFTLNNSFDTVFIQSDIRFTVNKLFAENHIKIPFPQREVYINQN